MSKQVFSQKDELVTYLKKGLFLAPFFLLVACGSPIDRQSSNKVSQINKTLADAEGGDPNAQFLMGTYYYNGESYLGKQLIPQNKEKAKEFFDKSASSGNKAVQKSVNQFLAIETLSAQLAINKSMAQNFYNYYGVTSIKDYESAVLEIKSLGYPVKSIASITPTEVIYYLDFKKNAIEKNISLPKAVQDLKKEQDAKIAQQLAKQAEAKQQAELARQQEIKTRAEQARQQEVKARAEQAKVAEQEKNSWYSYKKFLSVYVCDPPSSDDSNPGSMLSFAKNFQDPTAFARNEITEGGQIVAVDIVMPRINGVIQYIRGKKRCEMLINKLNAQIKNENEALKNKYK
jgi:TPR repeat protein